MKEKGVVISTDIAGVFGGPREVVDLCSEAGFSEFGLEVLPIANGLSGIFTATSGKDMGYEISGIHGRLDTVKNPLDHVNGLMDWIKIKAYDAILENTGTLLWCADHISGHSGRKIYVNVHNKSVEDSLAEHVEMLKNMEKKTKAFLAIENGIDVGSVEETKSLVQKMWDAGAEKVVGTLDIVHAAIDFGGGETLPDVKELQKIWGEILSYVGGEFTQIHLPIGTDPKDSLPIFLLLEEKFMLTDLGDAVQQHGVRVILENQQGLFGYKRSRRGKEVNRLRRVRSGLEEVGVLVSESMA